jgi:hypothetical protein
MAFGKKKDESAPAQAAAEADDDDLTLFPDSGDEDEALPAVPAAAPVAEAAPVVAPAPAAAPATDALLSMFQEAEGGNADRSLLLEMAGDVDLADLLEELNTLAAAIVVVRS